GLGQLGFYLLGIGQTLGDDLTPLLQHPEDGSIGKPVKQEANDTEADHLGEQMRPVHTESPGNLLDLPATALFRQQEKNIHNRTRRVGRWVALALCLTASRYLTRNKV